MPLLQHAKRSFTEDAISYVTPNKTKRKINLTSMKNIHEEVYNKILNKTALKLPLPLWVVGVAYPPSNLM